MEFNKPKQSVADQTRTINYEGDEAFDPHTPERALYNVATANFLENTFYRSDEDGFRELVQAVYSVDRDFVLQLAAYARQEMGLRQVPQVLFVLSAYHETGGDVDPAEYGPAIMARADEPVEVLCIWEYLRDADWFTAEQSNTMPKPIKRGIERALNQFDAYQLAKYNTQRRERDLRDVINMVHPTPYTDHQDQLFGQIVHGPLESYPNVDELPVPETWETVISSRGNSEEAWRDVLPRMGLFARIRNIRNMLKAGVDEDAILDTPLEGVDYETGESFTISEDGLTMESVRRSYVLPFRYYTAYIQLTRDDLITPRIATFLEDAVNVGSEELPDLYGNSIVGVDVSGSMRYPLSMRTTVEYMDIAALFGGIFGSKGATTFGFASKYARVDVHPDTPALEYARRFYDHRWGQGTNANRLMNHLWSEEIHADRVVLLTDGQIWRANRRSNTFRTEWLQYKDAVNPEASLYVIDLSSYETMVMPETDDDVYQISGWDDNILNFIKYGERPDAAIREVREYELP